mgnify:CR=1 FL=1
MTGPPTMLPFGLSELGVEVTTELDAAGGAIEPEQMAQIRDELRADPDRPTVVFGHHLLAYVEMFARDAERFTDLRRRVNRLPGLAQVAIQGGAHVAKLIQAKVDEESTANEKEAFDYFDKGSMAIVKRFNAVVKLGKTEFGGFAGWVAWLGLHLTYVIGLRSRLAVLVNGATNILSRDRGNLEITTQQRIARNIINKNEK